MDKKDNKIGLMREMLGYSFELLSIRAEMARLDVTDLLRSLIKIVLFALFAAFLFIAAFVSLLFGLDAVLPPNTKIWVFSAISVCLLLVVGIFFKKIISLINAQQNFLADSVQGIREDLSYIKGQRQFEDLNFKEWLDDK